MTKQKAVNKSGFTLMELLIVVVIIGLLSAIALPMYKKAVERSRASDALTTMQAVAKSEHDWYQCVSFLLNQHLYHLKVLSLNHRLLRMDKRIFYLPYLPPFAFIACDIIALTLVYISTRENFSKTIFLFSVIMFVISLKNIGGL